eukprot:m.121821 g.121821  ORF g.121821 m.121821 type:complete len:84 (+) comp14411_c0_seq3:2264-2515(+)
MLVVQFKLITKCILLGPGPAPIPPACISTLNKICPGDKGQGSVCKRCLMDHIPQMKAGGCIPAPDGSMYATIKTWCNLTLTMP